jgi:hypothetical protein
MADRDRDRRKRPTTGDAQTAYPSLREHLATRRRFLGVAGASLAAGALHAACNRSLGAPGDPDATVQPPLPDATVQPPLPDATVPPPDTGPIPGTEQQPEYYTVRIPVTGELSAYLIDEGYAQFYVEAVTYVLDSANALTESMASAEETCRLAVVEHTYDSLSTAAGLAACEDDLLGALDQLVMDLEGHQDPTLEYAVLTITYLQPYAEIGGARGEPSYP